MIGQAVLEKKSFENGGHIHVYSPGTGADNPPWGGKLFFIETFIQSTKSFAASFPIERLCNSFPPF